jgi:hypothetical protein
MTPELVIAIKERIKSGQTREQIKSEVIVMGHTDEVFEAAYLLAQTEEEEAIKVSKTELPTAIALIKNGASFAWQNLNLTWLLALPTIASLLFVKLSEATGGSPWSLAADALAVLSTLIYLYLVVVVLFVVAKYEPTTKLKYQAALVWARRHFLSFVWISFLTGLLVLSGFLLLIIPGIVVLISLFFSTYVLVHEDKTGMGALWRSREMVTGRWFTVARKVSGLFLGIFAFSFAFGVVAGLVEGLAIVPANLVWLIDIIFEPAVAFVSVIMTFATNQLFLALQSNTPAKEVSKGVKYRYYALLVAGVIALVLLTRLAVSVWNDPELLNFPLTLEAQLLQQEIKDLSKTSLSHFNQNNGSYEGVCSQLTPLITMSDGEVKCNETKDGWALAAEASSEVWCADNTGYAKKILTPLEDRTTCVLPLAE